MVKHGGRQGISFLFIDQTRFNFSGRIVKKNSHMVVELIDFHTVLKLTDLHTIAEITDFQ